MQLRIATLLGLTLASPLVSLGGSLYPMEGGNLRREARNLSPSPLRMPLRVEWSTNSCLDLGSPQRSPIILSDRVIQGFFEGVRCYDRMTGQRLWSWKYEAPSQLWGAPCYDPDRDRIYVNCFNGDTIALDASTGDFLWQYYHKPYAYPAQTSSAMYAEGRLYVGNGGAGFLCLDPDTRAVLWELDFPTFFGRPYSNAICTPAYDNGDIYLSIGSGDLFRLVASTGAVVWHVKQDLGHSSSPLLSDEYIYVLGNMSRVECRSRADGSLVWTADTHTIEGETSGNLALCGETLIVPGDSWRVWGLNRHTGSRCWDSRLTGNFAYNSPLVVCGKVYISACHGDFYGLDGATGQIEWRLNHGDEYTFVGWAEADGQLYVCQRNGTMLCFVSEVPGDPSECRCDLTGQPPVGHTPSPMPTSIPRATPYCWGPEDQVPTVTRTPTPTSTPTPTRTESPVPTATPTRTFTPTGTWSEVPTDTSTPDGTVTFTPTDTPTFTPTGTLTPTEEPTLDPTCGCHPSSPTPTPTWDATCGCHPSSYTPTPTPTLDPSSSLTPTPTDTGSPVPVDTHTPTPQGTGTPAVPSPTDTPAVPVATDTPVPPTLTRTPTPVPPTPTRTPGRVCDPRPYPNPCRGSEVRCKVDGGPYDKVDLKVFSSCHRRLKGAQHPCTGASEEEAVCDLRDDKGQGLANGLYFLQVETERQGVKERHLRKFVVCR